MVDRAADRRPGLAATAIFNLAAYWSEFALALVLLDSQSRFTIPLGVFSLQSAYETEWQLVAAASFIGLVPMMAAFVLLQRSSSPASPRGGQGMIIGRPQRPGRQPWFKDRLT